MQFIRAQIAVTPAKALTTPQLSRLKRESIEDLAEILTRLLFYINSLINLPVSQKLNTAQITLLTVEIIEKYWYMKFDELVYVLREGSAGKFSKLYGRLDTEIVHSWFTAYETGERQRLIDDEAYAQHLEYKSAEGGKVLEVLTDEQLKEFYAKAPSIRTQMPKKELPKNNLEALTAQCKALPEAELTELYNQARQFQAVEVMEVLANELATRKAA